MTLKFLQTRKVLRNHFDQEISELRLAPLSSNIGLSVEWWAGTGLADDPEFHDRVQRNSPFDSNIFL